MAQKVKVNGTEKALTDLTLAEVESLAGDAAPSSAIRKEGVTIEGDWARLAQEMKHADAKTVGELGPDKVSRWADAFGLQFLSSEDFAKSLLNNPRRD